MSSATSPVNPSLMLTADAVSLLQPHNYFLGLSPGTPPHTLTITNISFDSHHNHFLHVTDEDTEMSFK